MSGASFELTVKARLAATGKLQLLGQYTMLAATNDGPDARAPNFGKHMSIAFRESEKAAYLFGGDGGSTKGVQTDTGGLHYNKIVLGPLGTAPVHQHFYPYRGIAGEVCPDGYDCAPFTYDSKRDQFWQAGGYYGSATRNTPYIGIPETGGVWNYKPCPPDQPLLHGEWGHVSREDVYGAQLEGMQAFYHPRTDCVIGVNSNYLWWYECATGKRGWLMWTRDDVPGFDGRNIGRFNAIPYDAEKDEIFVVDPIPGNLMVLSLRDFPNNVPWKVVAKVPNPEPAAGYAPTVFVPPRRELVCMYTPEDVAGTPRPDSGIVTVNVDTGEVKHQPYPPSIPRYITQACYCAADNIIVGVVSWTSDIAILGWAE